MGGKLYLGEFEHIVMAAVLRLDGEAYGTRIIQEIEDATGTRVKSGSLYITLDRLEAKGYVASRVADPEPGRGGRPKRYMTVTPAGLRILKEAREVMLTMWQGLESRLEKA
jgi:DNA-binding PadR family transcriptional regulator